MDWVKKEDPRDFDFESGEILLIDKPLGWTSFDVVNKVRNLIKRFVGKKIKVGHSGTLDPLASGLLVLASGKKTKTLESLTGLDKEYEGRIRLGASTPSYDLETAPGPESDLTGITNEVIGDAVSALTGEIQQVPPAYSAIKKDGKALYKSARKGKKVEVAPRTVHVYRFEILSIEMPDILFRVHCGKGTYIRSLAHDLGVILGVGAHLASLRRTAVGSFHVEDAYSIDEMTSLLEKQKPDHHQSMS